MINLKDIKEIFLSGCNIYGVSYIGALKSLSNYIDLNKNIVRWIGTSAGGMVAFCMAIGYTPKLLEKICPYIPYKELNRFGLDDIITFFETFGLNDGEKMDHILEVLLVNCGFSKSITFKELYDITGKELGLLSFCLQTSSSVLLDYNSSPNLSIVKAVRMSSAIPFIFKPISYDGRLYVDGFISDNTPADFVKYPDHCLGFHVAPNVRYTQKKIEFFDFLRITFTSPMHELDKYKYKKHSDQRSFWPSKEGSKVKGRKNASVMK